MTTIGVSHGAWRVPAPVDPPAGDYEAIVIGDKGHWRWAIATDTWEALADLNSLRVTSPPELPAVWYAWRTTAPPFGPGRSTDIYKTTNNGTSWTALASRPFTPDDSGTPPFLYVAWEDHLTAATQGILLTAKWSNIGGNPLRLKNIYYSTDDGASWSQVYASDFANGNTEATWAPESLVVNTEYTWYIGTGADEVIRISHGGGVASQVDIPLGGSFINAEILACDSATSAPELNLDHAYVVARKLGETKRYILRIANTTVTDITPSWGLSDGNLGNAWIAVVSNTIMVLAYGLISGQPSGSIWRSLDAGANWTKVRDWNSDLNPESNFAGWKKVAANANRPNTWWVVANNSEAQGSKAMRSTDNGLTWTFHNLPSADPEGVDDQHYYEVRVLG